jgi:phage-related protein
MASSASNAARTFASNLISGIQSLPSRVASIGSQIVQGIARGISGAAGAVVNALGNVVQSAINAAKRKLGIASPSKVFATEVGQWIPKGAAAGILAAADSFYDAVDEVMGYMPDVGGYALDGGDMTPAASAGGLTVVVDGLAVNDLVGIRDTVVDFAYALAGRV